MTAEEGVIQHAVGHYEAALQMRLNTLGKTSYDDPRLAGLHSTIALCYDRLGERQQALDYADSSLALSLNFGNESEANQISRAAEAPSVQLNAGIVYLREAARLRREDADAGVMQQNADATLNAAWDGIAALRRGYRPHQWAINAGVRRAAQEAVAGRAAHTLTYALGTAALGVLSESPLFVQHASDDFGVRERMIAKAKTIGRGLMAIGLVPTALPRLRNTKRVQNWRDNLILRIT